VKLYDVSMTIHQGIAVYKNNEGKRPILEITRDFGEGGARESKLTIELHTGTHIDAPLHFVPGGHTVDKYDPAQFIRPCRVLDLTDAETKITRSHLVRKDIAEGDFVLLKTLNSLDNPDQFNPEFVFLAFDGAGYLIERKVSGVGIDALGIERSQPGHETHKSLLGAGIPIIEGLRLADVPEGEYMMSALPLKIRGAEASPARVVLWKP
jgi:arylformamidase